MDLLRADNACRARLAIHCASCLHAMPRRTASARCTAEHRHGQTNARAYYRRSSGFTDCNLSRRRSMLASAAIAAAALLHLNAPALAASTIAQYEESKLPKEYQELSAKLTQALIEAVEMDLSPAPEREVRRTADQAKGLVKEWIANWRDNRLVTSSSSHKQIKGSIQELGLFYTKNGQRARLPSDTGKAILEKLNVAAAALPI